jgi:3-oxoacyl-[acyl-carrier-protein] synthase II
MKRVVITGMDLVTALGPSLDTSWPRLRAGDSAIAPITYFDAAEYSCRIAAEVRDTGCEGPALAGTPPEHVRRGVRLYLAAATGAWRDAGLDVHRPPPSRTGVAAGVSVNYVHMATIRHHFRFRAPGTSTIDLERFAAGGGCEPAHLFYRRQGDLAATVPARVLGATGPTIAIDTACAASAFAVGEAFRTIQRGRACVMVAGGGSALVSPVGILAFSVLGALSRNPDADQASRPFDRHRDGFVMGEGAGAVVLEERERALARGARVYAELCGYGSTLSGHNLTDPSPDGVCEAEAIRLALAEARLAPEDIDYVAAHGTSTVRNDAVETAAVKQALGRHARCVPMSSNKGQIGHTIAAAGVCNLIVATKAMQDGYLPPTAHYRTPDPQCDLDYVPNVGRPARIGAALAHAFAFGGQNAVLAIRQP